MHDTPEAIVFPGWGVPRGLYFDALEQTSFASVDIVNYGFFKDEESPLYTPVFDQEEENLPPVIAGHSMGALFAVRLALQNIEAVQRLILINPFPKFVRDDTFPFGWERSAVRAMRNGLKRKPDTVIRSFLRTCAMPEKYPGMFPETFNIQALDEGLAFIEETDIRQELTLLAERIPVFVIDDDDDFSLTEILDGFFYCIQFECIHDFMMFYSISDIFLIRSAINALYFFICCISL